MSEHLRFHYFLLFRQAGKLVSQTKTTQRVKEKGKRKKGWKLMTSKAHFFFTKDFSYKFLPILRAICIIP